MGLLDGGVAVVTGAASGIGRASARAFAREGAVGVVVADVNADGGEETVALIKDAGGDAMFIRCDVSLEAEVEALVSAAVDRYGRVDYAHNNAGAAPRAASLVDVSLEDWDRLLNTHLKGVFLCMKHEIRVMLQHGKGAIVNTASIAGLRAAPRMSAYSAAKHGIVGLTKSAALEFSRAGIRVNALCPGHTETPMHSQAGAAARGGQPRPDVRGMFRPSQMDRMSDPSEQAEVVVWLCSDRPSYLTGAAIPVDGGQIASV